jgi:AcrR family transcriptional regulator
MACFAGTETLDLAKRRSALTKIRDLDQIVDVAARLFGEKGYEATRLEDIAAELDVLKGSLYYYISSKSELFYLVLHRRLVDLLARVQQVAASDAEPDEKLVAAIGVHLHYIAAFSPESSQWFAGRPQEGSEGHELHRQYHATFASIIEEGVGRGTFRDDIDVFVATLGVLGASNWLTQWYRKDGRLTIEEICETLIPMLVDGLRKTTVHSNGRPSSRKRREARPLSR